jgi:hypothetical protein
MSVAPTVAQQGCKLLVLPTTPSECCEFSMGKFRIWVRPQFRSLVAPVMGWNANTGVLTSPLMIEGGGLPGGTLIAHSAPHAHGSNTDLCAGTQVGVGTGATPCFPSSTYTVATVSDSNFVLTPPGFQGPAGRPEVHTEIVRLNLQARGGLPCSVKAGPLAPGYVLSPPPPRSFGEVQAADNAGNVPGGKSFFNVFIEAVTPPLGNAGVAGQAVLYNTTPLLVVNGNMDAFPPSVAYLHENSSAVPVYFFGNNGVHWNNGDLFGYLVLSGHGVGPAMTEAALDARLNSRPNQVVPEGGSAGPSGPVGLSLISGPTPSTAFTNAAFGVTQIGQVGMVPHPNGVSGQFLGGVSVQGLPAALGGLGGWDVCAFTYNRVTNVVTPNASAAAFNTAGDEFALNFAPDGTYAVCDRLTGTPVVVQARQQTGCVALGPVVTVAGVAGGVDPCPSVISGEPVLFFNTGTGISYRKHNVQAATLTGTAVVVSQPSVTGGVCHSPWPILGADGEASALLSCQVVSGNSHWNWQGDLNPATPLIVHGGAATVFQNNGCEAGGRVYMPQQVGANYTVQEWNVVGATGDRTFGTTTGGSADLLAFTPIKSVTAPADFTLFIASIGYLPTPLVVPGINNAFGLDLSVLILFPIIAHDPNSGRASYSILIPPALGPLTLTIQGLSILTSTAGRYDLGPAVALELF